MSLVFLPSFPQVPAPVQPLQYHTLSYAAAPQQQTVCFDGQSAVSQPIVYAPTSSYEQAVVPSATKRNYEEAVAYYPGTVDNQAKKVKREAMSEIAVSKVVHLRSLPADVSDAEVIKLGLSYGKVTNVLMLKGKNQAFLEMEDEEIATTMVRSSESNPPTIRQRIIYVQFSNHKELKTDNSPNQIKAQAALQSLQNDGGGGEVVAASPTVGSNHVLRVVVENMLYPVTLEVLQSIFSQFGAVTKIVIFNRSNQFQALIQMDNVLSSQHAKLALDGQNIYSGCCTLRIEFSRLESLNVKFNNEKSRDFTRNDLPTGSEYILGLSSPGLPTIQDAATVLTSPPPQAGGNPTLTTLFQQGQLANIQAVPVTLPHPGATQIYGIAPSIQAMPAANNVLHVSNLNEEMVTSPDMLFILFGVYGDVKRVKILFQKKNSALVQMHDAAQAQIVIKFLNGVKFFGRPLTIVLSKHTQVQMPKEGADAEKLTQDYSNSNLHRFKKPGSKNFHNIFPPSDVLHLSNIAAESTDELLRSIFSEHGTVIDFKFFQKNRKMALIQLSSVEEAIKCLVLLHNYKLTETNHLRVSFSKRHI